MNGVDLTLDDRLALIVLLAARRSSGLLLPGSLTAPRRAAA